MPKTWSISQASSCTYYSQLKALDPRVPTWLADNAGSPHGHHLNPCLQQLYSKALTQSPTACKAVGLRPSEICTATSVGTSNNATDIFSLCTVLDTGILLGNNSDLCHSTAQDWRQCYFACNCTCLCTGEKLLNSISHNSWSILPLNISVLAYFFC